MHREVGQALFTAASQRAQGNGQESFLSTEIHPLRGSRLREIGYIRILY